jgi:hypothetical protein
MLSLGLLLAACTGGPAASPTPDQPGPTPGTSPTPGGSPINSPEPTSAPSPTPAGGPITHPTGATDVILRMETGGGFVPLGFLVTQAPEFTLYGDGTFIIQPLTDPELPDDWDAPRPRFLQGRLDAESVQALLDFALETGRLREARDDYRHDKIADASTTIFTIAAGGVSKTVSVYALAEVTEPTADAADRRGFYQLSEVLRSFEDRARAGELGEIVLYEPTHYQVTLLEAWDEAPDARDWPWQHISPDDFAPAGEFGPPVAILSADDVAAITDVPSGGHPGVAVVHNGTQWLLGVRPLLPDEAPQARRPLRRER